jgi:IclR family transcriptional regulator, KDG regulon repressor
LKKAFGSLSVELNIEMDMIKMEKSDYIIKTVSHALDLLEQFHDDIEELGLVELSHRLTLNKSSVLRLLATLVSRNYIDQNKVTYKYRLGLNTLRLGQSFIKRTGLLIHAKPVMKDLVKECNETALVAILKDFRIFYLDALESGHAVRVVPRVGAWLPAYCTAAGKAQIAFLSDEELDTGVRCVAAPIRDYSHRVVGAVSISGPSTRLSDVHLEHVLIPLVKYASGKISSNLGYSAQI